jgi:MFS family permease
VLAGVPKDRRGVVAGLLSLSRNLGLILGASVMGAVFAFGVGTSDFQQASPLAITNGLRLVFGVAGGLMVAALGVARRRTAREVPL